MSSERVAARSGTMWMTVSAISTSIVALLRLSILTRFLEKTDFGIVAIITFVLGLTHTFADLGFSSAIIHKQGLTRKDFSNLYWIQLIVFSFLYLIISLCSPLIANFYSEPSIKYLLPISLLDLLCLGIGRLYDSALQKEFKFKTIAIRNIVTAVASLIVAVVLAELGCGIYSLIISTLFHSFTDNLWNAISGQKLYKLTFSFSFRESLSLVKIGLFQTGTQIVDYFASKFDVLIIGKFLGSEQLGIYSLAKELVIKLVSLINSIANRVILPFFAMHQNDNDALCRHYSKIIRWLSVIDFPICIGIGLLSTPIIYILYGSEYADVANILSILALVTLYQSIGNPVGSLAIAKGKTDISFKYTIVRVIITVPVVFVTSMVSLECVVWGQMVLGLIMFVVGWKMLINRLIEMKLKEYLASFFDVLILNAVVGVCLYFVISNNWLGIQNSIIELIIYGIIMMIMYAVGIQLFFRETLKDITSFIFNK